MYFAEYLGGPIPCLRDLISPYRVIDIETKVADDRVANILINGQVVAVM